MTALRFNPWEQVAAAAAATGLPVAPAAQSHQRRLTHAGSDIAIVELSLDMRWVHLTLTPVNRPGGGMGEELRLGHIGWDSTAAAPALHATLPLTPDGLAAGLAIWREDVARLAGATVHPLPPTAAAEARPAANWVETLTGWQARPEAGGTAWRLARQPAAPRHWPPLVYLATDARLLTASTRQMLPVGTAQAAAAGQSYSWRFNAARRLTGLSLTPDGATAIWRMILPLPALTDHYLTRAWEDLLVSYRQSASVLQALCCDAVASVYCLFHSHTLHTETSNEHLATVCPR